MKPESLYSPVHTAYYLLNIKASHRTPFRTIIHSNTERAYIIAILQDTLGGHALNPHAITLQRLATTTDLLAFSITRTSISLLLFAFNQADVQTLGVLLINKLIEFQESEHINHPQNPALRADMQILCGPHDALHVSTQLHAQHSDWEHDRYSSIGFYLHGRRGDWMRLWRLTRLYNNHSETYRALVCATINTRQKKPFTEHVTSLHA
ncbi:hypothetical protein KI440_00640 [Candidatus Saccharibacteria bacterium TM7i]|nr:hypothetical protein KI440_00640 [Candidatus Saccharibacteria bacterium TM7i]